MRQECITILSASDVADVNGGKIDSSQLVNASFQARWSDIDLIGTIKIQASNDPVPNGATRSQFTPTNWTDIPNATIAIAGGSVGSGFIILQNMAFSYIRAVLLAGTPGTGTAVVNMDAVGV